MSTRSTIKIEGIEFAKVYKHLDGNPGSMLDWLNDFNQDFTEKRGEDDNEYKFAQLLRFAALKADKYSFNNSPYTGWGVVPFDEDMDEEFEYLLKMSGEVSYLKRSEIIRK